MAFLVPLGYLKAMSDAQPFYLLEESEPFQEAQFFEQLKSKVFGKNPPEISSYNLKQHSVPQILEAANTYSMFAPSQFIMVQQHRELSEENQNLLIEYIKKPNPSATMVWRVKKVDKRKKFYKQIQKLGVLKSFASPKPQEMGEWVDRIANRNSVQFDRIAKATLIEFVGTHLSQINQEIKKLALYIHPETKVLKAHVEAMVLNTNGENVFAFTDQVTAKNIGKAFDTLGHLLHEGTVPLVLLSMLVRHYRILLKVHDGLSRRIPHSQLASFAAVPPFLVQRYVGQTRGLSAKECRQALVYLQDLDRELKSTGLPNRTLLEGTIMRLRQRVA